MNTENTDKRQSGLGTRSGRRPRRPQKKNGQEPDQETVSRKETPPPRPSVSARENSGHREKAQSAEKRAVREGDCIFWTSKLPTSISNLPAARSRHPYKPQRNAPSASQRLCARKLRASH